MVTEKQKFNNIWIWLIILSFNSITIFAFVQQIMLGNPFGSNPAPNLLLILTLITTTALLIMLIVIYLKITIDDSKIEVQFYPFLKREILFKDIKKVELLNYKPIKEYGGWGFRYGQDGEAFSISGTLALSITLLNGKKVLLGVKNKNTYTSFIELTKYGSN